MAGFVHNDRRGRTFLRGDLVFVSPAAVIGHPASFEHLFIQCIRIYWIGNRRIVNKHQDRFAAHIDILEIVPLIFRCDDAIANEDNVTGRHSDVLSDVTGPDHAILRQENLQRFAIHRNCRRWLARDAHQRHLLQVSAVRVAGLQADAFELLL